MAFDRIDRSCATLPRGETVLLSRRPGQNWRIELCQRPPALLQTSGFPPTLGRPEVLDVRRLGWLRLEFATEFDALKYVAVQLALDAPVR